MNWKPACAKFWVLSILVYVSETKLLFGAKKCTLTNTYMKVLIKLHYLFLYYYLAFAMLCFFLSPGWQTRPMIIWTWFLLPPLINCHHTVNTHRNTHTHTQTRTHTHTNTPQTCHASNTFCSLFPCCPTSENVCEVFIFLSK